MSSKIFVKKKEFLSLVDKVYGQFEPEYILRLSQALMIIYKKKKNGNVRFDDYDGFIEL